MVWNDILSEQSNDQVINPELQKKFRYYTFLPELQHTRVQVEVDKIRGSTHYSYNQSGWYSMLNNLHRPKNENRDWLKWFITTEEISEKKTLHKYGEDYYICAGNHRCCYAKFLGLNSIACNIIEHTFDDEVFDLVSRLESLNLLPEVHNYDRNNWTVHIGEMVIRVNNISNVHNFIDMYTSIKMNYWNLVRSILISLPSNYYDILYFENTKGNREQIMKAKFANYDRRLKPFS